MSFFADEPCARRQLVAQCVAAVLKRKLGAHELTQQRSNIGVTVFARVTPRSRRDVTKIALIFKKR